ncbi:GGDEF domain-containing protein [Marinomonas epiphytica]
MKSARPFSTFHYFFTLLVILTVAAISASAAYNISQKAPETLSIHYVKISEKLTNLQILSNELKQELDQLIHQKEHFDNHKLFTVISKIKNTLPELSRDISASPLNSKLKSKLSASARMSQDLSEDTLLELEAEKPRGYYCQIIEMNLRKLDPELTWLVSTTSTELSNALHLTNTNHKQLIKHTWLYFTLTFILVTGLIICIAVLYIKNRLLNQHSILEYRAKTLNFAHFEKLVNQQLVRNKTHFALILVQVKPRQGSLRRRESWRLIQESARLVDTFTQGADIISAHAANELCVFKSVNDKGEAFSFCEELRYKLTDYSLNVSNSQYGVEATIGFDVHEPDHTAQFTDLFDHAEAALELAIQSGGNQSRLYNDNLAL